MRGAVALALGPEESMPVCLSFHLLAQLRLCQVLSDDGHSRTSLVLA